jgi:uncharacterized protein with HEPN domain
MPSDSDLYLDDILESIRRIELYAGNESYEEFHKDLLVQDGVCRNLAIIGEAVKKLPASLVETRPEIEWRKIAGLRDILVHEYAAVDLGIVWDIVTNKLPALRRVVEELRKPPESP